MDETKKRLRSIYIAGPMKGLPKHNTDAFFNAEEKLRLEGWVVVNPVKFEHIFGTAVLQEDDRLLRAMMDAELAVIPRLDAIYLPRGWEHSEGAKRELQVALEYGLIVMVEGAGE